MSALRSLKSTSTNKISRRKWKDNLRINRKGKGVNAKVDLA